MYRVFRAAQCAGGLWECSVDRDIAVVDVSDTLRAVHLSGADGHHAGHRAHPAKRANTQLWCDYNGATLSLRRTPLFCINVVPRSDGRLSAMMTVLAAMAITCNCRPRNILKRRETTTNVVWARLKAF